MLAKTCKRCGKLIYYPNIYCDNCKPIVEQEKVEEGKAINKRDYAKRNKKYERFYHSKAWKRLSNDYLTKQVFCEHCGQLATEVHHIEPIQTPSGWTKRLEWSNLSALCIKCHNKQHRRFGG